MKKTFYIVLLISILSLNSQAWIRVGNGGEGVTDQNQIYIRDLYEQGSHVKPYFGKTIDSAFQKVPEIDALPLSPYEKELLARKLTDIEKIQPLLGQSIAKVLSYYRFNLSDDNLYLGPNDSPQVPDDKRVSLAIRQYYNVFIAQDKWAVLSPESRIALLIHEAFYSLARPECQGTACEQQSLDVRPFVGNLFSQNFPNILNDLRHEAFLKFNIDELKNFCQTPQVQDLYEVYSNAGQSRFTLEQWLFARTSLMNSQISSTGVCQKILDLYGAFAPSASVLTAENFIFLQGYIYGKTNDGSQMKSQVGVSTSLQKFYRKFFISNKQLQNCYSIVGQNLGKGLIPTVELDKYLSAEKNCPAASN